MSDRSAEQIQAAVRAAERGDATWFEQQVLADYIRELHPAASVCRTLAMPLNDAHMHQINDIDTTLAKLPEEYR
jgi:hypothetical protein